MEDLGTCLDMLNTCNSNQLLLVLVMMEFILGSSIGRYLDWYEKFNVAMSSKDIITVVFLRMRLREAYTAIEQADTQSGHHCALNCSDSKGHTGVQCCRLKSLPIIFQDPAIAFLFEGCSSAFCQMNEEHEELHWGLHRGREGQMQSCEDFPDFMEVNM